MASADLTFDVQVDPGVQVFQARGDVSTAVRPGMPWVCIFDLHRVWQFVIVLKTKRSGGPMDRPVTMAMEGEGRAGDQNSLSLIRQVDGVQMDQWRTRRI